MPRAMWSGSISFGLVNIPVKLYKATASTSGKAISFHQIHKTCGTRLKHIRWCPKDEVEVPWDEVAKGYEIEKGKYVEVSDDELDEIVPEEDYASIAIESFVSLAEVDPIFYDRAYFIAPDAADKAYALLHQVMSESGKVAVARVLLRTRSHLSLVRVLDNHLILETMFYANEIAKTDEIPGVKKAHADKRQMHMAQELVESMTSKWEPSRYKDEYTARLKHMIEEKIETGEVVESPLVPSEEQGTVVDLLDALRRSVAATQGASASDKAPAQHAPKTHAAGHTRRAAKRAHHARARRGGRRRAG